MIIYLLCLLACSFFTDDPLLLSIIHILILTLRILGISATCSVLALANFNKELSPYNTNGFDRLNFDGPAIKTRKFLNLAFTAYICFALHFSIYATCCFILISLLSAFCLYTEKVCKALIVENLNLAEPEQSDEKFQQECQDIEELVRSLMV